MTDQEYSIKLIKDALVLIKDICLDYDGFRTVDGMKTVIDEVRNIATEALRVKVHEVSTEDVVPVVHAHWVKLTSDGHVLGCSNCKYEIYNDIYYPDNLQKYCSECGAKMDAESEV